MIDRLGADRPSDADVQAQGSRASALRTNAPRNANAGRPAQRAPRFPDTPWGRLRGQTGWSLRELAERTGINPADLSRIERGIGPKPDHARRLLAVYDGAR
jgi:ribosome-binding protein aMBF1 (putative translation factor)